MLQQPLHLLHPRLEPRPELVVLTRDRHKGEEELSRCDPERGRLAALVLPLVGDVGRECDGLGVGDDGDEGG